MRIEKTNLKDCYVIHPKVIEDDRGYFFECFHQHKFIKFIGQDVQFVQDNESKSKQNVIRGLHFQKPPFEQAKLMRVLQGEIQDVAVDLRKNSPTYGQYHSVILNSQNKKQFFIPRGFAHGFLVLSESAVINYKIDNIYSPEHDTGIIWEDKDLAINWQINKSKVILSQKDKNLQNFKDFNSPF